MGFLNIKSDLKYHKTKIWIHFLDSFLHVWWKLSKVMLHLAKRIWQDCTFEAHENSQYLKDGLSFCINSFWWCHLVPEPTWENYSRCLETNLIIQLFRHILRTDMVGWHDRPALSGHGQCCGINKKFWLLISIRLPLKFQSNPAWPKGDSFL